VKIIKDAGAVWQLIFKNAGGERVQIYLKIIFFLIIIFQHAVFN